MTLRFCTIGLLFASIGCAPSEPPAERARNIRSFVASAGYYSIMAAQDAPTPEPASDKCAEGCKCAGTGREKSGDGITTIACRCPDSCRCKKKGPSP